MALKRKRRMTAEFSMASMTDMIFLLLIFFMITSTVVVPNAIKVMLPQSAQQTKAKLMTRVTIDANENCYVAFGREKERLVNSDDAITEFLLQCKQRDPDGFVALYADESLKYSKVVHLLDLANRNKSKMVLVTRPK